MAKKGKISLKDLAKAKSLDFNFVNIDLIDGDTVKRVREELGLTQYLFAKLVHVSKKTIEKWEEGGNPIKGGDAVLVYLLNEDPKLARSLLSIVPHNQEIPSKYKVFLCKPDHSIEIQYSDDTFSKGKDERRDSFEMNGGFFVVLNQKGGKANAQA